MKLEALNNKQHAKLKVNSVYKIDSGFDYNFCPVYPLEYTSLQSDYPIFFTKEKDNDAWQTIALLGFKENEMLVCGISIGYEDTNAPENSLRVEKLKYTDFTTFLS